MKTKVGIISFVKTNDQSNIEVSSINAYNTLRSTILKGPYSGAAKQELLQFLKYPNFKECNHKEQKLKSKNKYIYKHADLAMRLQTSGVVINRNEISKKTGNYLYNKLDTIKKEGLQEQRRLSEELIANTKEKRKPRHTLNSSALEAKLNVSVSNLMIEFPGTIEKESELISPLHHSPSSKRKSNYAAQILRNSFKNQPENCASLSISEHLKEESSKDAGRHNHRYVSHKQSRPHNQPSFIIENKTSAKMNNNGTSNKSLKRGSLIKKINENYITISTEGTRNGAGLADQSSNISSKDQKQLDYMSTKASKRDDVIHYQNQVKDHIKFTGKPAKSNSRILEISIRESSKLNFQNRTSGTFSDYYTITEQTPSQKPNKITFPSIGTTSKILSIISEMNANSEDISKLSKTVSSNCFWIKSLVKEKYNPKFKSLNEQISLFPKIIKRSQNRMPLKELSSTLQSDELKNVNGNDYILICKSLQNSVSLKKFQEFGVSIEDLIDKMKRKP